jgi:aminoglycoside 6'-N-acetyltransferase I
MTDIVIRPVETGDREAWVGMRLALWPDAERDELAEGARRYFEDASYAVFLARVLVAERLGEIVGMIELSLRSIADGCASSPVPYIEGWFVAEKARRQGVGSALVRAAENWARERGASEIASDILIENQVSEAAHKKLGFEEVARMVSLRKSLA